MALLGVRVVRMLDYAEGDLGSRGLQAALVRQVVEPIRMHRPEVIVSFGPDGVTGDSDHVVLSRAVAPHTTLRPSPSRTRTISRKTIALARRKLYDLVVPQSALELLGNRLPPEGYGSRSSRRSRSSSGSWRS